MNFITTTIVMRSTNENATTKLSTKLKTVIYNIRRIFSSNINQIKNYIDDSEDDSFDLRFLEKLYIDGLAEIGKSIDSHITRFAAKIVNADIGLTVVQWTSGGKYKAFKTSLLAAVIPDAE